MGKKNKVDPGTEPTELETERGLLEKMKMPEDKNMDLKLKQPINTDRGENIDTDRNLPSDRPLVNPVT